MKMYFQKGISIKTIGPTAVFSILFDTFFLATTNSAALLNKINRKFAIPPFG
jgi:hypothetical protein